MEHGIHSEQEYREALARIREIIIGREPGKAEELRHLADLVEDYEQRCYVPYIGGRAELDALLVGSLPLPAAMIKAFRGGLDVPLEDANGTD